MRRSLLLALVLFGLSCLLPGCSTGYIVQAAIEEGVILINREDIDEVIEEKRGTEEEIRKLRLVRAARNFAGTIGLDPGDSFTQYTKVDRDVLAWVLVAAKRDSFELRTWWFPIVGEVPYKGYFDKEDAIAAGNELVEEGYEGWIRGAEAFSTLGWFDDPVISTTLKHSELQIVNTVLHESVHSTVWIPDHVEFNESLANFIGHEASVMFFENLLRVCESKGGTGCAPQMIELAVNDLHEEFAIAAAMTELYTALDTLYKSERTREEKIASRGILFEQTLAPHRESIPRLQKFTEINNAQIFQFKLYLSGFPDFKGLYDRKGQELPAFLDEIKGIRDKVAGTDRDPFQVLKERVAELDAELNQVKAPFTERDLS